MVVIELNFIICLNKDKKLLTRKHNRIHKFLNLQFVHLLPVVSSYLWF